MIEISRIYRLIRDFNKLSFISKDEFQEEIKENYSSVHDNGSLKKLDIVDLLSQYSKIKTPLNNILLKENCNNFEIVDYGGGLGKGFYQLNPVLKDKCKNWQIIEKGEFIQGAPIDLLDKVISYHKSFDSIKKVKSKFKICYSNSGIQYSGDMALTIRKMACIKPDVIILERIPLIVSQSNSIVYARQKSALSSNYRKNWKYFDPKVTYNLELYNKAEIAKVLTDLKFVVKFVETVEDVFSNFQHRIGLFDITAKIIEQK
jgi:putative methyltransferase (TIGR04325 family)